MKILIVIMFLFLPQVVVAALQVGDTLTLPGFKDQFDVERTVSASTKVLVFARGKEASKIVQTAFEGQTQEKLTEKQIVYLADISGMPSLVTKFFALPKMKKYPYDILLDRDGSASKPFELDEKSVQLVFLNQLKIEKVEIVTDAQKIKAELFH